jgi:predicted RNA-binding protein with PUA domain
MKIVICSSATFAKEVMEIKNDLEKLGHKVLTPHNFHLYADGVLAPETREESTQNKVKDDLIRRYYNEIKESDAVLAVNKDKHEIKNYIGGNVFLEIGFAHVLNKKVFLLNPVPNMLYSDEIMAMEHVVINGDLSKIV